MIKEALSNLGDVRSRMFRELRKNLNFELFDLQYEISSLKKENDDLKMRIKELECNFAFVSKKLQDIVD